MIPAPHWGESTRKAVPGTDASTRVLHLNIARDGRCSDQSPGRDVPRGCHLVTRITGAGQFTASCFIKRHQPPPLLKCAPYFSRIRVQGELFLLQR